MKYWLLTSEYPPFFGGGISTYCHYTARMLAQNGHTVSVFVNDPAQSGVVAKEENNVRVIRFGRTGVDTSSFLGHVTGMSYEFAGMVRQFIGKEGAPDIIEAQEYLGIAYYLLQFKKLLYDWCKDIPVLVTAHSPSFLYLEYNHVPRSRYPNYWIGEMERFCLQAADRVVSPSEYLLKELAARFDLSNRNVSVVANPFQMPDSGEPTAMANGKQIVFYGKLSPQKGIFRLLEYFTELWKEGFVQPLHLIGGTDIVYHPRNRSMGDVVREKYKAYIDKGLLVLEGKISPDKIADRLAAARLVIIPSTVDNLPYVVLEMMAIGKIVFVSKQGGQAEIVGDGINGFVFDHDEPGSFIRRLKEILAMDEGILSGIAARAKETIAGEYDFKTIYSRKMSAVNACVETAKHLPSNFPFLRQQVQAPLSSEAANTTQGLISVVIPYYNLGAYIDETIVSLRASSYPAMEILIINDGTTDPGSLTRLEAYRHTDGIKVYDTDNHGLASARNYGARMAKGEFLAFLDADDRIGKEFYGASIRVLKQYDNVYFAGCWTKYFGNSSKTYPTFTPEPPIILYHNVISSGALVYKRAAFLTGGLNDPKMSEGLEDYDSVISMVSKGLNGVALPEVLFYYRIRESSMARGISRDRKLLLYEHITQKYSAFYGNFAADLFDLLNANGPGINLDNPTLDYHLAEKLPFGGKVSAWMVSRIKRNKYMRSIAYRVYRMLNK